MSEITLDLTGIAHGGEAFGRHEGKIVFVPYAIPGEKVRATVVEEKARWARAQLVAVLESSPDRVDPPCPYFGPGLCGGCQWQHIAYERQLQLKGEIVADQLRRLGRIEDPAVLDAVALADDEGLLAFGYRNHVQMVPAQGRFGYVRASGERPTGDDRPPAQEEEGPAAGAPPTASRLIAVDECLLLHPLLDELHQALAEEQEGEAEADADAETGPTIRRVGLRVGINTGERMLAFETQGDRAPGFLVEDLPVRCVVKRRDGSVQGLIGEPWIEEMVAGRTFRISAASFFQVNTVGAEALVHLAAEMLAPTGHETLLDGYCGVGLFGLSLASQVGQVVGIESSEIACEDFAWNARGLDNVALYEGPVAEVLATLDKTVRLDLAVIDPPRSGAGPEVVAQLRRLGVRRLLYVSCDPATLARDTRLLTEGGYRLQQVQPVDLFPQTFHIESLALFSLS